MQDRSCRHRNLMPAIGALPTSPLRQFIASPLPTSGTNETIRPAAGSQVLLASFFGGELRLKFTQRLRKRRTRHASNTTAWGFLKQPDKQKPVSATMIVDFVCSRALHFLNTPEFLLNY